MLQQNAYGTEEAKVDGDRQGVGGVGGLCTPPPPYRTDTSLSAKI